VRVQLAGITKSYGARVVLDDVTFGVGVGDRLGLVGPNGVGKSTLLRIIAGLEPPDAGSVTRAPASLTAGYLPQEPELRAGETLLRYLARRTGVEAAERELETAASALGHGEDAADRYDIALGQVVSLGGADLEGRAGSVLAELGLRLDLDRGVERLSGGERARLALASILLSRFDVLLLDEPTNDLDAQGLERLQGFLDAYRGGLLVVSHDRAFLDATVDAIVAVEPGSGHVRRWAGGWSDYAVRREEQRQAAYTAFEQAGRRRRELTELISRRRTEARAGGAGLGEKTGGADRRGTNALRTKVRQAERQLARNELPEKPFEPWELRLELLARRPPGSLVVALEAATAALGAFSLGPVDLDLLPGERLAVAGPNGSGKTTLLGMLLGTVPLVHGRRRVGPGVSLGVIGQDRDAYDGGDVLLDAFRAATGLVPEEARTLLAKFGLGVDAVHRSCATLSPGERTRAHLAELQARDVNVLVLDEPTNHLDLEAIEQLERALAGFAGTVVVVSHDRRFLDTLAPTRVLTLGSASYSAPPSS
jgi:ATPase subunit of ABC transporter with duplicated ATPase domains